MGGHGGLNILPQKSWNVYNYENREKVRLDEEKQAQEQQEVRDKALKNDREFRHRLLLERASKRLKADTEAVPSLANAEPAESHPVSRHEGPAEVVALTGTHARLASAPGTHINLFEDFEHFEKTALSGEAGSVRGGRELQVSRPAAPRPPTLKEAQEASKRGKGGDESHRLGHGCVVDAKGKRPWYTSAPSQGLVSSPRPEAQKPTTLEASKGDVAPLVLPPASSNGKKSIAELRAERLQREKAEQDRALRVQGLDPRKMPRR
eukprot:jgi/Mesvir1/14489/Mv05191-RA.1